MTPSAASARISASVSWRPIGSSPAVGSSSSSTRGSLISACASPTFWVMPEENVPSRRSATSDRSNCASRCSMRSSSGAPDMPNMAPM